MNDNQILSTVDQVAERTGLPRWTVQAVKKASLGMADSPFAGRYTTRHRIETWLFAHPEFIATRVMRGEAMVTPPLPVRPPPPRLPPEPLPPLVAPPPTVRKPESRFERRARHIALLAEKEAQRPPV